MHSEMALAHLATQAVELVGLVPWLRWLPSILHENLVALKLTHACLRQQELSMSCMPAMTLMQSDPAQGWAGNGPITMSGMLH